MLAAKALTNCRIWELFSDLLRLNHLFIQEIRREVVVLVSKTLHLVRQLLSHFPVSLVYDFLQSSYSFILLKLIRNLKKCYLSVITECKASY